MMNPIPTLTLPLKGRDATVIHSHIYRIKGVAFDQFGPGLFEGFGEAQGFKADDVSPTTHAHSVQVLFCTINIDASYPYKIITDNLGNQILYFRFENLPPYATKIITITADLEFYDNPNDISIKKELPSFHNSERYVESDSG